MSEKLKKPFPFTIGADPEFTFANKEKRYNADSVLRKVFGRDYENHGCVKLENIGNIGVDGNCATAELRPDPSPHPAIVAGNLGKLIAHLAERPLFMELSTKQRYAPIGGHIHFEYRQAEMPSPSTLARKLGTFYLGVALGEDLLGIKTRINGGYGALVDQRTEPRGHGVTTFEFRAPTAEWMISEKIARSTLAFLATVYNEICFQPENFKRTKDIVFTTNGQGKALQDLALSNFVLLTTELLRRIKRHVRTFEFYAEYKEEIDYILNPNRVLADKKKVNFDLLEGWELANNRVPSKRTLVNEKTVRNVLKQSKVSLDAVAPMIPIFENNDPNIALFAGAVRKRVVAYNWKLKNTYMLFGLKSGIDSFIVRDMKDNFLAGHEQVKTTGDLAAITETTGRMKRKLTQFVMIPASEYEKTVLIGIPYAMRMDEDTKKFIELIADIEKGALEPMSLEKLTATLTNDNDNAARILRNEERQEAVSEELLNSVGIIWRRYYYRSANDDVVLQGEAADLSTMNAQRNAEVAIAEATRNAGKGMLSGYDAYSWPEDVEEDDRELRAECAAS